MKVQVRYYSRSGNTKSLANAIAKGAGVEAISVDAKNSTIDEKTDILFIGGALYAYGLDNRIKNYISKLNADNIGKAIVFSTSWISKHSITLLKSALKQKGIPVVEEYLYYKNNPNDEELMDAEIKTKELVEKNTSR